MAFRSACARYTTPEHVTDFTASLAYPSRCSSGGKLTLSSCLWSPILTRGRSMITFLAAMVFVFFDKTNLATQIALGAILGVLALLIVILLYMEWEGQSPLAGLRECWSSWIHYVQSYRQRRTERKSSIAESDVAAKVIDDDAKSCASTQIEVKVISPTDTEDSESSFGKISPSRWWGSRKSSTRRDTMDSDQTLPVHA